MLSPAAEQVPMTVVYPLGSTSGDEIDVSKLIARIPGGAHIRLGGTENALFLSE